MAAETKPLAKKLKVFSYPSVPHVYQLSPFALKLESWLRVAGLPYDVGPTMDMGPKGKVPYIEFEGGERVGDSNVLITKLTPMCADGGPDAGLTKQQRAVAQAVMRMMEEHTIQIIFWWRYCRHLPAFERAVQVKERVLCKPFSSACIRGPFIKFWLWFLPREFGDKFKKRGLAAHSDEELIGFSNDDLRAVSDLLGDGPFFFGEKATTVDCALFGHLANFLYLPMHFPQKDFVKEECPNLLRFLERFKQDFWPDWEEKCNTANNN